MISKAVDAEAFKGILLKGVTGSGKTEVYLRAAERALERGGSALILVPEIALTSQMTSYFASLLGDKVVFIHSGLSKGERYNNRQRIANGESTIIIGSRSAIFMPFRHLKLIVVDEEYDSSYKQGETPRYNGRDAAKMMGEIYHCPIVLGAATPSIATYHAAKTGKIELVEMKHRVFQTKLPAIHIYDLKGDPTGEALSHPMVEMLRATIERKEKSILLLNRRGFSTTLMCADCGYVFKCPNCDVSLVYHKDTAQLKCHYCETVHPLPHECPKCHSRKILYLGRGAQHVEEDLHEALAEARIQRFDVDSTQKKNSARTILENSAAEISISFSARRWWPRDMISPVCRRSVSFRQMGRSICQATLPPSRPSTSSPSVQAVRAVAASRGKSCSRRIIRITMSFRRRRGRTMKDSIGRRSSTDAC